MSFRPEPYVKLDYTSAPSEVDAGDGVQFNVAIMNNSTVNIAHNLNMNFSFMHLERTNLTFNCSKGIKTFDNLTRTATLKVCMYALFDIVICSVMCQTQRGKNRKVILCECHPVCHGR